MNTKKSLILAVLGAVSIGAGAATAQESAGGSAGPSYEVQQLLKMSGTADKTAPAPIVTLAPRAAQQYGSSDDAGAISWPVLDAADGSSGN